jgi:hypothetical protein
LNNCREAISQRDAHTTAKARKQFASTVTSMRSEMAFRESD